MNKEREENPVRHYDTQNERWKETPGRANTEKRWKEDMAYWYIWKSRKFDTIMTKLRIETKERKSN